MKFLRNNTKNITVTGIIQSLGEYDMRPIELRMHEGVSILDEDGETLHFSLLIIPKSLSDKIKVGKKFTLNIIRVKQKAKLAGSVYAVKEEGEIGYIDSDLSLKAVNTIIRSSYKRFAGGRPDAILMFVGFLFVLGWIGIGITFKNAVFGGVTSGLLTLSYYIWPLTIPALAKMNELVLQPLSKGYQDVRSTNEKY